MMKEIIQNNRSYRRFYQDKKISKEELREFVNLGRLTPSGANKQLIRFALSWTEEKNAKVYECLRWAGYYTEWDGPVEGERPSAYIILVAPRGADTSREEGIIGQTILLAAVERGMGGCFIANVDRKQLAQNIDLPEKYEIKLVLALGYPKEKVVIEEISEGVDIKYYRDAQMTHHVPKIRLEDLILKV